MAEWTTSTTRITVDGKTYSSADEMPPEVREKYQKAMEMLADRDGNGVPDILEGKNPPGVQISKVVSTTRRFVVNGREYKSLADVPGDIRHLLEAERSTPIVDKLAEDQEAFTDPGGITIRLTWPRIILLAAAIAVVGMIIVMLVRG